MSHFLRFLGEWKTWITTKNGAVIGVRGCVKNIKTQLISVFFIFCVEHYNLFAEID